MVLVILPVVDDSQSCCDNHCSKKLKRDHHHGGSHHQDDTANQHNIQDDRLNASANTSTQNATANTSSVEDTSCEDEKPCVVDVLLRMNCPFIPSWDSDAQHRLDCECDVCMEFYSRYGEGTSSWVEPKPICFLCVKCTQSIWFLDVLLCASNIPAWEKFAQLHCLAVGLGTCGMWQSWLVLP